MNAIERHYDVIIAGTGLYGTTLGSILARHGVRVLLIERGTHPRFALGEALLPQSAIWPFVIAQRFGAEDVGHLSHADRIVDHITPTCGLKHSIGFAWQQPGRAAESQHVHQLIPPHLPFYSESHLYRPDVDLYMLNAAREQGCDYEDETEILGVTLDPDRVAVRTDSNEWTAEIFIDSSGGGSRLVQQEGYRKGAPEAHTHSRSIFAHVEGLPAIDQWVKSDSEGRRLHDGTFHHVFPGGWMWVIPFDNFARSTSRLASVGLMLDPRVHPEDSSLTPQQEFDAIIGRFPTMAAHFEGVRVVRPFTRTGRLQFSATTSVGHRHVLAPATFGAIDAIYSNGLVHTFESVFRTAHLLLSGLGRLEGASVRSDFSVEALRPLDELHRAQWHDSDRMASCAYAAMHHPGTWAAWTQAWLAQVLFSDLWLQRACFRFLSSGNPADLDVLLQGRRPGSASPVGAAREVLLDDLAAILRGGPADDAMAARMFQRLAAESWLPRHVYDWGNPAERSIDFSRQDVAGALLGWGFTASPEPLRSGLFDFPLPAPPSA
jgi:FADH2 O2-dependent halogenase